MTIPTGAELLEAVERLSPLIRSHADENEVNRRVSPVVVGEMARAGLFRMSLPQDLGGSEVDPLTAFRIIEEVSRVDGSTGWILMIGSGTSGFIVPFLSTDAAAEIFVRDPDAIVGGTVAPRGSAVAVPGGYRVTGRWPFASGCQHSDWLIGSCVMRDDDPASGNVPGSSRVRIMVMPVAQCEILDTWNVGGMRSTGSHDFQVRELFVPNAHSVGPDSDPRTRHEPTFAIRFFLAGHASHALGLARHAIESFATFATTAPAGAGMSVRDRPSAQSRAAQAEAMVAAARAYILSALDDAWGSAVAGEPVSRRQQATIRLAMTWAVQSAAQAIDLLYDAAGGAAIYSANPFERCFRDIHTATQHSVVASTSWESLGRTVLGVDTESRLL